MKNVVIAIGAVCLLMAFAGPAAAQAYGPYGYNAYPTDPYAYAQAYDPYYELHQIHYQLYLRQYGYYPYPYFVPSAPVIVATPPAVIVAPFGQPLRTAPVLARRR